MAINVRKNRAGKTIGYTAVVAVPDPSTGAKARRSIGTFLRRRDAEAAERKALVNIQNGLFTLEPPVPALTVADAVDAWFAAKRGNITTNSAAGYESAIRLHLLPAFGDVPVADVTQGAVQAQVDLWQQAGMGATLVNRCLLVLRGALTRQVRAGTIPSNPVIDIEKPSKIRKRLEPWTDDQLARFLCEAEQDRLAIVWFLAVVEGMRRGEVLGLSWSDLAWSADRASVTAHIRRSLVPDLARGGKAMLQDRAKTRSGERAVMLTAETTRVLVTHRDRQLSERQRLDHVWSAGDLVVTTSVGSPVNPSSIKRSLSDLIARAGVPPLTMHQLRHQAVTTMLRNNVSPVIVAAKVGHASISVTNDTYGHLIVRDQASANAALEAAIARGREATTS